ncbi:MAG: CoA pyrophosphatase, partial [Steroidobacteraceae bacterium]|nr:CoA pyrophosphatase [Steroidobacteraceae bacterium]MDW8260700.1 CoA pyrophosphatase [Gammaproteobacteria bacterium]
IGFPGGRIEPDDADVVATALRECEEEIGLARRHVQVLGMLPDHVVVTGFRVTPVVALIEPNFTLRLDRNEVDEVFEVPLEFVLNPLNHRPRLRSFADLTVEVIDIPYGERNIWGATAGMLLTLYRLLNGEVL